MRQIVVEGGFGVQQPDNIFINLRVRFLAMKTFFGVIILCSVTGDHGAFNMD